MNDKKLSAFLSLWKPDKEHSDAGGQGQGKFVLMRASKEESIIVESIDEKQSYKCKFLQRGRKSKGNIVLTLQDYIPQVDRLNHKGTKIWVYDINKDFLETLKSEEFVDFIRESWWQILGPRFNAKIILFGKEVKLLSLPLIKEEVTLLENKQLKNFGTIKRLVLVFYEKPIPEIFRGIRVQRANMMIRKIPFEVYEKDYRGRFSGYIEFDQNNLERLLKDIEKTDHCDFLYESPWKEIKSLIREKAERFVAKNVPSKKPKKTINLKNLSEIISRANQIIREYCSEILGGGTVVPPIPLTTKPPLRIKYLIINKREVKFGDIVKPSCGIINGLKEDKGISLHIELKRSGSKIFEEKYKLKIGSGKQKTVKLSEIKLEESKFQKGKYTLRVTIVENKHDIDTKSTSFYLETKRESIKKGFIKQVHPYESDDPVRNKPVKDGKLEINLGHKDFMNIYDEFQNKPNLLNKQAGFYLIKICLDEAINELFKMKIKENHGDLDDLIQAMRDIKDKMYYDVYV
jgi:hypothetical protein